MKKKYLRKTDTFLILLNSKSKVEEQFIFLIIIHFLLKKL